jgi:hypothetical protein
VTPRLVGGLAERVARRRDLERRLRAAWLAGAVEEWQRGLGRPPTDEELGRIIRRYDWSRPDEEQEPPWLRLGDVPDRNERD